MMPIARLAPLMSERDDLDQSVTKPVDQGEGIAAHYVPSSAALELGPNVGRARNKRQAVLQLKEKGLRCAMTPLEIPLERLHYFLASFR
jgi:hypothetical protein